jgi:hypothetical protein
MRDRLKKHFNAVVEYLRKLIRLLLKLLGKYQNKGRIVSKKAKLIEMSQFMLYASLFPVVIGFV